MYGQNRNSGISSLHTYEQAKKWYEVTKPIKGSGANAGTRPLGHRSKPWFSIWMNGDDIVCRCHSTDVVTFHPDNTISINDGGYTSQTTASFISDVLGAGTRIGDHSIILYMDGGYTRLVKNAKVRYEPTRATYTVLETGKHYTHSLNRKRMGDLRKTVAPFMKYVRGINKVTEGQVSHQDAAEAVKGLGHNSNTILTTHLWYRTARDGVPVMKEFIEKVKAGDEGNWHSLYLALALNVAQVRTSTFHISETELKSGMDDILIAVNPSVLDVNETPLGVVKVDKYARFKPFVDIAEEDRKR